MEVENLFQNWLSTTEEDDAVIHDGLRHAVGQILVVFYEGDGIIDLRDPE